MTIRLKLIGGFAIILLLIVVTGLISINTMKEALQERITQSSLALTTEMLANIDENIHSRIELFQVYSKNTMIQEALLESNKEFETFDEMQSYIEERDHEWRATPDEEITGFMNALIANDVSDELRTITNFYESSYGYNLFGEIFLTNKYAANIAQTGRTTDYYQADENWWQKARENELYVEDVKYDDSAEVYSISICIRIDDANGDFIGVMKVVTNIQETVNVIDNAVAYEKEKNRNIEFMLLSKDAKIIHKTGGNKFLEPLDKNLVNLLGREHKGQCTLSHFVAVDRSDEDEKLLVHAHSEGCRDFAGLDWILVVKHNTKEVFAPVVRLRNQVAVIIVVSSFLTLVVSILAMKGIIGPISQLKVATAAIRKGDLSAQVNINSKDEMGQLANSFNDMANQRKKAENEREMLLESLSEKTSEMENLLRIVTHDLRVPLVNIQGFGHELEADCKRMTQTISKVDLEKQFKDTISTLIDEDIPNSINFISTSAKKMDILIDGLNQLVKAGKVELKIETLDMNELVRQVTETVHFRADELGASVNIESLPDCKADAGQINQVFSNLINNSLKYFDPERKSQITITGQVEDGISTYCIEDNGIGIPQDHICKIFDLFHQVGAKSEAGGEGVGLATAKQIIDRNNGRIWVESEEDKGSKFFVSLPNA